MKFPQLPKERRHRKRFSGETREEDDTFKVGVKITDDGFIYHERRDGSLYPKNTTITVAKSTWRIYGILREVGHYHTYDELLLDIALPIIRNKSLPVFKIPNHSLGLSDGIVERLEHYKDQAIVDKAFRARARKKASEKQRYERRKTSTY